MSERRRREGEGETSGVCGDTGVYTSLYRLFLVSERRMREGETAGVCGDTRCLYHLYGSFPVSERERGGEGPGERRRGGEGGRGGDGK